MQPQTNLMREMCALLADELEREVDEVTPEKRLVEDLEADSVALLAVVETLLIRYPVPVELQAVLKEARTREVVTVNDLCGVVGELLQRFSDAGAYA
jgi:acyl carrier protein